MGKIISGVLGGGTQTKSTTNPAFIDQTQQPYLSDIYGQAQAMAGGGANNAAAGQFFNQGMNQGIDPSTQNWLQSFQNPGLDPAVASYSKAIGQQFNEQILPGLRTDATLAGGLGNSRAQIGEALAGQRATQAIGEDRKSVV